MKICVAQTRPIAGDIQRNIENHKKLIAHAISDGAGIIIFPELSITGYEPTLAKELATDKNDSRFDDFQKMSDTHQIIIGVGMPTHNHPGVCISMIVFQPNKERQCYSKKYLHADEEPFFVSGENLTSIVVDNTRMAFAICYELSVPDHSEAAFKSGAQFYIASVAKSISGVEKAITGLSDIAVKYSMTVLMSNCVWHCDDFDCGGKTSIWNSDGLLAGQLDAAQEGILIIDTTNKEVTKKTI
jgi:predicted amidohydrolase